MWDELGIEIKNIGPETILSTVNEDKYKWHTLFLRLSKHMTTQIVVALKITYRTFAT